MDYDLVEPNFMNWLTSRPVPASPAIETETLMNLLRLEENASDGDRDLMFSRLCEAVDELTTTSSPINLIYNNNYILLHRLPKDL